MFIIRPDGSVETYEYDANGQLTKQTDLNGDRVVNSFTYGYDTAGNITSIRSENVAGEQTSVSNVTMKYDAANRLIKYNGKTVTYDADGNMTYGPLNGELASFTYDCRNRLVSAGDTSYEYDAENNRIGVTTGTTKTSYVVENNSGALSRILSATERSSTEEQPADTTLYIYGNGLLAQEKETGEYLLYHFNNIGSTSAVTDMDGTIVHAYAYGTYGELLSGNREGIRFLYNGRYGVVTDENGLYYMRARYYNVDIKRFINQDVLEGSMTDSPSLNRYAYCQGNPVKLTDPFGLSPNINWSTLGHAVLDALGFIPVVGAIADTLNGVWYMSEGDYFSAAASFVSAIPGWGDIVGAVGKGIKGCSKITKAIKYGSKIIGRIGNIALGSYQTGSIAVSLYDKHIVQGESWDWDSTVQLFSAGVFATTTAVSAKGLKGDVGEYRKVVGSESGSRTIIKNGKISIDDLRANPSVFSGRSVDEIAQTLKGAGYDITIQKSAKSKSGAQIIKINNPGGGKNISQVQVSPGGGRHGRNPYVKISTTDQGIIKIVDGSESLYKTDGKETATIIFSGGN